MEGSVSGKRMRRGTLCSRIRMACIVDMMGGKPSCNVTHGHVSPTLTSGRASVNDVHVVCYRLKAEMGVR